MVRHTSPYELVSIPCKGVLANFVFQLGDHDKALRIFVHKMKDFRAAEDYCDQVRVNSMKLYILLFVFQAVGTFFIDNVFINFTLLF